MVCIMHGHSPQDHTLSHLYNAWTEYIGFSHTKNRLSAPRGVGGGGGDPTK